MNPENGEQIDCYMQNDQDIGFKCDICALTFRISSERNIHILSHFQKENCSICSETLIRLGNIWYSIREHSDHNVNRNHTESNTNGSEYRLESVFADMVKSEPDPIYNEQTEIHFEECFTDIAGSSRVKAENDNTNFQTEFVQVPDFIEQKPFNNIYDKPDKSTDAQGVIPANNDIVPNEDDDDATKVKIKGQCHICMKKIVCATGLKSHINLHFGIKPYVCDRCEKPFTDKRNMNVHKKACKGKRILKTTTTNSKQSSTTKKSTSNEETTQIPKFNELNPLNIINETDTPVIDICESKEDENVTQKAKIIRQCHICEKKIACATSLKYHMNLHLGIKPFGCEFCDKAFADKRNLLKHSRTHKSQSTPVVRKREQKNKKTKQSSEAIESESNKAPVRPLDFIEERPLDELDEAGVVLNEVDEIGVDVEIQDDFKRTEDTVVMPEIKIKGQCHVCEKKFVCASALQYHLNVHFGVKPYECEICSRTFADKRNLKKHLRIHKIEPAKDDDLDNAVVKDFYADDNLAERESENTDWVCEYCNADFKLEITLAKHILKYHDDRKSEHSCFICIEKFSALSDLSAHMRAHPESTQYKCTFDGCDHGFAYKAKLSTHLGKHRLINGQIVRKTQDDVRPTMMQQAANRLAGPSGTNNTILDEDATCNICSKKYSGRAQLQQHIQTIHNNERIKCLSDGCDKIFKGKTPALSKHIQIHHPELIRECETCKKVFYSEAKLAEHQRRHNVFACSLCPKTFPFKHRLIAHMGSHEREAKCDICNKGFTCVKRMMVHRECHGNKKMISCRFPGCDQSFQDRREFMLHANQQHPENDRNKSVCSYCGKSISKSFFKDHINIHTGARPYECLVCKKKFAVAGSFARHNLIHTNIKPYVCNIDGCSQAYRDSIDLKRHKFSVHKIYTKKHICSICAKVFSERKLLRNHIVKVHDKVEHESVLRASETITC